MALGSALVDKARVVSKTKGGTRVDGEFVSTPDTNPWFRCRLEKRKEQEGQDQGRVRGVVRPTMIYGRRTTVKGSQRVEVVCKELHGNDTAVEYIVEGDPEPYRRKRSVIGWEVGLARVDASD